MADTSFVCAVCKGTFACGISDEEATEQLAREFPGAPKEECVLVCDECFTASELTAALPQKDDTHG